MELRPGYKQTEVGVIPENWEVCAVRQKGEVVTGKALAVNGPGKLRPYLRTKNVFDGRIDIVDVLSMPMTDEQFAQFRVRSGDVLLNEGQSLELVGRCALYQDEYPEPCAIQNQLLRFRAYDGVCPMFASYLFRRCQQTGVFARIALQTTSIAHLGGSRFERLRLAWPIAEAEQRAIATALSDADALIASLDALIAKKRDLKRAAMQHLLTGKTRLPGFHVPWRTFSIGEVFSFKNGLNKEKRYFGTGTPIINYMDVFKNSGLNRSHVRGTVEVSPDEIRTFSAMSGDVFFTRTSETVEEIGVASVLLDDIPDAVFSGFLLRGRPKGSHLINEYKRYCFSTYDVRKQVVSSSSYTTRALTNGRHLSAISIPIPPIEEQANIASVLSDMDAELAALEARRDKARAIKQGMMQELLTGRIRLL